MWYCAPLNQDAPILSRTHQGEPRLLGEEHCQYRFTWETGAACPQTASVGEACTVLDRASATLFDLTPLSMAGPYVVKGSNGKTYDLGICLPLPVCESCVCVCLCSSCVCARSCMRVACARAHALSGRSIMSASF